MYIYNEMLELVLDMNNSMLSKNTGTVAHHIRRDLLE